MQPLGRKPKRHNFEDRVKGNLRSKGHVNWWEFELDAGGNKKGARQESKKEIKKQAEEY